MAKPAKMSKALNPKTVAKVAVIDLSNLKA
jgi:hypothetical protein